MSGAAHWQRLRLPLIAAPMLRVSGPALVTAACRAGVVGAFPTANARSVDELDQWLTLMRRSLQDAERPGPVCPNLIIRQPRLQDDLACLVRHRVEMVITSVGSPASVVGPLHDVGCTVFADVASVGHAEKALRAGADGLVLLSAGAGGQTGWANGMAFARAIRQFFDGPLVMAGGISDGHALWAARALGCDLGYMGTKFIATEESMADARHKAMVVSSRLDDVMRTRAFTGLDANMLRPSVEAAGLDPDQLDETVTFDEARVRFGAGTSHDKPKRWRDIWSAGHSVSGVTGIHDVAELVAATEAEYEAARRRTADLR
ncbi:nitronate monooxygenase family protein [Cupriavidus sp. L7L]|uniref:NAD(P)H-dependent flavin oxidoreductase n=1 Tax=Cupriavidus sp. L7L TaxID=2546443 RepID=UPI001A9F2938|nr:nitronate monooxygenase [Cupriavidus sp. L7L]